MSSWVVFQRTTACHTRCEEFLFALVLGAIYIFSFFNAKVSCFVYEREALYQMMYQDSLKVAKKFKRTIEDKIKVL